MKKTELFFPFEPVPKGRPKFVRATGRSYTPKKTVEFENTIRDYYKANTHDFYDTAVKMKLIFNMPIPESVSQKKKDLMASGYIKHTKRPDADNMVKSFTDSINGVAYRDDSLITELYVVKRYATNNNVGIEMIITEDVD